MDQTKSTKDIPEVRRESIPLFLDERSRNGRLKRGAAVAAAAKYGCNPRWLSINAIAEGKTNSMRKF
ncbi:hypothetical protein F441_04554 [Phytophthora nicotianae CJ01A1]|uniref:Uncharacterized protein n=3 Tax=Phytophthora nicotianae TaxID=4792 RepID=W2NV69_PHYNI|nr:hypothetical protein L916_04421 [Phytophthora nicotianae]ETM51848.1 hypothetical protein L914_04396 [Phytophthora nicotianae]ETP22029.1 hypothetical protein F441_04554 [Phytophthora nicotianae CJ01A1]